VTETTAPATINITIPVPVQVLRDLLVTAAEGGSNYWARISVPPDQTGEEYTAIRVREHSAHSDDKPAYNAIVKAEDLAKGLAALATATFPAASKHLTDAITENHDAITADVVLQMAIFGDVIYG
jgi:hypothetical protein